MQGNFFSSLPGCTSFKQESTEKLLKSAAHHVCQQASAARQVLEHAICEGMQLAVEEAATVDLTRDSEESQEDNDICDSSDRTMVTFSSFLPLL